MTSSDALPSKFHDANVSFRNKAARGIWGVVYVILYRPSPRLAHGWRRMLLRLFGARIGDGAHPYPTAQIWAPWYLEMGKNSTLGEDVFCYNVATVRLGEGATVSLHAYLCAASRDIDRPGKPVIAAPITIGADAWVAAKCFIGPGVTIGEGAVVGARSTVTKDVAAFTVVAGSPPRVLRARNKP
jgi:putative colanic acid biosynthesis acetyltransferase WcaF